jgi:hypothetical protein
VHADLAEAAFDAGTTQVELGWPEAASLAWSPAGAIHP